jgi:hypothetical protein
VSDIALGLLREKKINAGFEPTILQIPAWRTNWLERSKKIKEKLEEQEESGDRREEEQEEKEEEEEEEGENEKI